MTSSSYFADRFNGVEVTRLKEEKNSRPPGKRTKKNRLNRGILQNTILLYITKCVKNMNDIIYLIFTDESMSIMAVNCHLVPTSVSVYCYN